MADHSYALTLSCQDQPGIVAAVTNELFKLGCNIAESSQYWDRSTNRFFMRIAFAAKASTSKRDIQGVLSRVNERFDIETTLTDTNRKPRIATLNHTPG